ncbi:MAG: arylmalonate decarboxylase [Gammaproteobacteria bacterium]|nr:arylmalonate decarboxylase [Gammaproteobacteria bacterium]NIR85042.1 arylmalonate decarboxylase [Gammaproteobacteria bacterium]NIR88309.1 arylmalonate decarboxylase [Gammaproteobacteria bacterium]NIU06089.1 arylmalonate decarboxylase [Gammaproteobacteria bacterium]NIV73508.1 arylmalonate decarboxylase [Gammaproteobacteria bacterium]
MSGTRIGILYPSDGVLDGELWSFAPPDVSLHFTRIRFPEHPVTLEFVVSLVEDPDIRHGAANLRQIQPAVVAYACTCVSFARGPRGDRPIIEAIEDAAGAPATTTSTALAAACHSLRLRRVALAAPYVAEITERLRAFLKDTGVDAVSVKTLGLLGGVARVSAGEVIELVRSVDSDAAEGIVVANTNLSTLRAVTALERELGKPVVTANQATIWHACRLAGVAWTWAGCALAAPQL